MESPAGGALHHLALPGDWCDAQLSGSYRVSTRGRTLEQVGFLHACSCDQLEVAYRRLYADAQGVLELVIDPSRLGCPVTIKTASESLGAIPPHL